MDQSRTKNYNDIIPDQWIDITEPKYEVQRKRAERLVFLFNGSEPGSKDRDRIIKDLLSNSPEIPEILSPIYFDYGSNTLFEENVFVNHGCYFMDGAVISIGKNVFIGPFCGFYTVNHPLQIRARNTGIEKASPITIMDDCWIGANVVILPGVTLQKGCVVAAGSIVTRSFPANSLIAGNPARLIRLIDQDEKIEY